MLGSALLLMSVVVNGVPPSRARSTVDEIQAQAVALKDRGGHDRDGRLLPVFVHAEGDRWVSSLPVYSTAALVWLAPARSDQSRWAAATYGTIDILLLYILAARMFGQPLVGVAAALLLLLTPSHASFTRTPTADGVWQVPFILGWAIGMTALTSQPSPRTRRTLAAGMASLAASVYAQPTAPLMVPMFLIVTLVALRGAAGWRLEDAVPAAAAFVAPLLPLMLWYARFPDTYPDTFGRWLVHPAHLRNPVVWLQALSNHGRVANIASLFSDFFSPSHLFLTPDAPGLCGMFLSPMAIALAAGAYALIAARDQNERIGRMRPILAGGCLVAPLAAAMFEHARSDDQALSFVAFAVLVAVHGAVFMWQRGGTLGRGILALTAIGAAAQAPLCLR